MGRLLDDARSMREKDPAARSLAEVMLLYPGFHALIFYRISHRLYQKKHFFLARMISQWGRGFTGIEIHPGAKIGRGLFIDHGAGVVIGETAEVEEGVVIYQGVTLGGTGKEKGKRHPTIKRGATISCGAKVLGGFTVGEGARIGAGAVVLKEVPPYATVVGVPGRVVRINGEKTQDLIPEKDDPILREVCSLRERVYELEERLDAAIRYAETAPSEAGMARTETADAPPASDMGTEKDAPPASDMGTEKDAPPASDTGAGKAAENR